MKSLLFASTAAAIALSVPVVAEQITLGNGGQYDFAGAPPDAVSIAAPITAPAPAFFGAADLGSYTFGPLAPTLAGPRSGGNFPTVAAQAFSYAGADGDTLAGTVQWSLLKDDSPNPDLIGALLIEALSGDAAFVSTFGVGPTATIDLVLVGKFPNTPFIGDIAKTGDGAWYLISAGEVLPVPGGPVSEPASLLLLASGLFGIAWANRRRIGENGLG